MQTTAEKRRAKLDRAQLLSLRAALCPSSGREKLSLNCVQSHNRDRLQRGKVVAYVGESASAYGKSMLGRIEMEKVGKLRPDECRAVQPANPEPKYNLLWADLTPHQRKQLRKYRAGKKQERDMALALRQLKAEGCRDEATRELNAAIKMGDSQAVAYWRGRLAQLRGH